MLAVQFLEPGPEIAGISPAAAGERLKQACDLLPLDMVILGWELPPPLVDACARVAQQNNACLYLWHPLLTRSAASAAITGWQTVNLKGGRIPGYQDMAEFTFFCPNHPEALPLCIQTLEDALKSSPFQGVFLDRIRFPSPALGLEQHLGCFCHFCQQRAAQAGIDLPAIQRRLKRLAVTPLDLPKFVQGLLDPCRQTKEMGLDWQVWSDFRCRSITRAVQAAADCACRLGLAVGLDCFAPSLTKMVGQDLTQLDQTCDWMKVMTYAHTYAPAGMPFELLNLLIYLETRGAIQPGEIPAWFSKAAGLPLPTLSVGLETGGISSLGLLGDLQAGLHAVPRPLLAGIELVDLPGVTRLKRAQIQSDLSLLRQLPLGGFVLSWDLWHIPPEYLRCVQSALCA